MASPLTILPRDLLRRCAVSYGDKTALIEGQRQRTWAELDRRTNALAAGMQQLGIGKGDVVAMLAQDHLEVIELWFACLKIGAVRVGINWRYAPREMLHLIRDSGAKLLFIQAECRELLGEGFEALQSESCLLAGFGSGHELEIDFEQLIEAGEMPVLPELGEDDLSAISYTGGTAGVPKGALWTQRGVRDALVHSALELGLRHEDIYFAPFPMAGVPILCGSFGLVNGLTTLIPEGSFDPAAALQQMQLHRATVAIFVPTMMQRIIELYRDGDYDLCLRLLTYGSSPATPALIRDAITTFGCEIIQLYGLTESTAGWLSFLRHAEHLRGLDDPKLLASCGKPALHVDIEIHNADGERLPVGEVGEVVVRSTTNIPGYLNLPDENAELYDGDWLRTNDLGRMDGEGYLYLTDRRKFMVITGGYNVYPVVVENVLAEHEAVREVAVVGVPHPQWGEAVVATVALKPDGAVSAGELRDFCREKLGRWEVPKHILFIDELPKGATGKVAKFSIRESLLGRPEEFPWNTG
jgi:acyl-CoA synthetase (AMP-forming)/AMP-acid ligase II